MLDYRLPWKGPHLQSSYPGNNITFKKHNTGMVSLYFTHVLVSKLKCIALDFKTLSNAQFVKH